MSYFNGISSCHKIIKCIIEKCLLVAIGNFALDDNHTTDFSAFLIFCNIDTNCFTLKTICFFLEEVIIMQFCVHCNTRMKCNLRFSCFIENQCYENLIDLLIKIHPCQKCSYIDLINLNDINYSITFEIVFWKMVKIVLSQLCTSFNITHGMVLRSQ